MFIIFKILGKISRGSLHRWYAMLNETEDYAKWFKDNNYDKWILARDGEKALSDKVEPYIKRDASLLEVGDILVADGHILYR